MTLTRRIFVAAVPSLLVPPAFAKDTSSSANEFDAVKSYERDTGARIGLYAHNVKSGKTISWRADERFAMCSTFKASLVACVLSRVDRGDVKLDRMITYREADVLEYAPVARDNLAKGAMSVEAMCKAAVELSDNTCANMLLDLVDGPRGLTAFWRKTGDSVSRLDHNEPSLNFSQPGNPQDTTTPVAMAGSLKRFLLGDVLKPASRTLLTDWMVNCKTGAKRLRSGLPSDWTIGDKTGSSGKDAAGDIAVAWPKSDTPILIAAYTHGGAPAPAQFEAAFKAIGEMVARRLG